MAEKKEIKDALIYIRRKSNIKPHIGLILGSGLGGFLSNISIKDTVYASDIPHYPISSVQGHAGKLIFGYIKKDMARSTPLLIFQGRVHFYETGSIEGVIFPVVLASRLGIKTIIITNAAGGINNLFIPGDIMLINDLINFTFLQPFSSISGPFEHSDYFNSTLQKKVLQSASQLHIQLQKGTYCWLHGPSYETPAEIQMLKRLGSDAIGMSTVPEIITAYNLGMKVVALSFISNMASGISPKKLSHSEVTETAERFNNRFSELLEHFILNIKH